MKRAAIANFGAGGLTFVASTNSRLSVQLLLASPRAHSARLHQLTLDTPCATRLERSTSRNSATRPRVRRSRLPPAGPTRPDPLARLTAMQSAPLQHAAQEPPEFPFSDSDAAAKAARPSAAPSSRRSSLLSSPSASSDKLTALFGKAWAESGEEIAERHEKDQKAFADNREL